MVDGLDLYRSLLFSLYKIFEMLISSESSGFRNLMSSFPPKIALNHCDVI